MAGPLYLCATPIGNLEDMTFRVSRTLKEADLIAAEDTRNSIRLLNHFDIHTPMTSYHEFNRFDKGRELVELLLAGKNIALITDAGTPGISDPGEELVRLAQKAGITVTSLPGACAAVTALTLSGLPTRRFCFEAFLPADRKERARVLEELRTETRTIILYEAPHRLVKTLEELARELGDRRVTVLRELTKKHETILGTTLTEAAEFYRRQEPRGECVLVLAGVDAGELKAQEQESWNEMPLEEHLERYLSQGMSQKDAMKAAAADRGVSKRDIYAQWLALKEKV
ncbi:MAG: 16S rRNA (cytidine(1402)-2'-O)-methyltransferase [Lachnospiraceae bacterium]|nr:16S rRNA (cytidine(1402)-2'-O)-methyltransferase [Lachnospiraceae bacterium]